MAWIADDPDEATKTELRQLVEGLPATATELEIRFATPLTFGTAGLRGPVRAGPAGMNLAVVRAAARGLVNYLDRAGTSGPLVIGYDGRLGSAQFAAQTARVCTGSGRRALMLPRALPTPVLAFAVGHLSAAAGVMVTASHNPATDNGYKVYLQDGAQLVAPHDTAVEAEIAAAGPLREIPLGDAGELLGEEVVAAYLDAIVAILDHDAARAAARPIPVAYTAMHGVGGELLRSAFSRAGFTSLAVVPEQQLPDPAFPTVAYPNPEEPGAMDLVLALAASSGAALAIANDPDADRCAVAVPDAALGPASSPTGWRILHGDELGILLADQLISRGVRGTYATTLASSAMLRAMAARHDLPYAETLTGFKWIARAGEVTGTPLAYGYEEALGYSVAPAQIRDKDGISAALLVVELTRRLRAEGLSLLDRLNALSTEYGLHHTEQLSIRMSDSAQITEVMTRLRAHPPESLLGRQITDFSDLAPEADVLVIRAGGIRVVVRPSGTEPKLKVYLEVVVAVDAGLAMARQLAVTMTRALRPELKSHLGIPD